MLENILRKIFPAHWVSPADFALRILLAYGFWKSCYYYLETNLPGWWTAFQNALAAKIVWGAATLLSIIGEPLVYNSRNVILENTIGIFVADHCIGIPAFVVFTMFIVFYAGNWKHKLWFIPFGFLCIYALNVSRTAALAFLQKYYSESQFNFSHNYLYTGMTYGLIFLLIVWWMEKFDDQPARA